MPVGGGGWGWSQPPLEGEGLGGGVLLPSAGHVNHWLLHPELGQFGGSFSLEVRGKGAKVTSIGRKPKLNPFSQQTLSLLEDEAWIRDRGRKTVIQVIEELGGGGWVAGQVTLRGSP